MTKFLSGAVLHYKTTIFGLAGGVLIAMAHGVDLKSAVTGAVVAALGAAASDH